MNHATLFSGIGGPEIASQRLGWKNIFSCEWEDFPRKILEYHFPNTDHYGDITKFNAKQYRGQIDVLTGGFPCQPFSNAGSRKGAEDERYLWKEMLRIIKECKPTWIIGENVAGIITMGVKGAPFEVGSQANLFEQDNTIYQREDIGILESICNDLEREGYECQPLVIPAEAVQAPHRRDRVFIVAYTNQRQRKQSKSKVQARRYAFDSSDSNATNTNSRRTQAREERQVLAEQNTKGKTSRSVNAGVQGNASDSNSKRSERKRKQRVSDKKRERREERSVQLGYIKHEWKKFPTKPPICSGDDGLSDRLDSITFSKWRRESIKAYGNAIVPEVIYRIYEGIDALNKKQKQ